MTNGSSKHFNFSQAFKELEEITQWFEDEDIDLTLGISKIKRGLTLVKSCRAHLKEVENEFTEIKEEFASETENKSEESDDSEDVTIPF